VYSGDAAGRNDVMIDIDDIQGAVARGWCHKVNEHKVMDPDLALAIASEVAALINTAGATCSMSAERDMPLNVKDGETPPMPSATASATSGRIGSPPPYYSMADDTKRHLDLLWDNIQWLKDSVEYLLSHDVH